MSFYLRRRIKLLQKFAFVAAGIEECTFDSDGKYDVIMWSLLTALQKLQSILTLKRNLRCS
jgi:hypothetical protein